MSFEEHVRKGRSVDGVCVAVTVKDDKVGALRFTFGPDVVERMEWAKGNKVKVFIGKDRDKGRIRVKKESVGYSLYRPTRQSQSLTIGVGGMEAIQNLKETRPQTYCHWQVTDGALEITLPAWAGGQFKLNEVG